MLTADLKLPIPLDELRSILKSHGVVRAYVFGSYARGEQNKESDLDLLVEMNSGYSLFDLGGLQYELEQKIPGGVDIATELHPYFEPHIKPELIQVL